MSGEPMELDHITNFSAKRSVYESIMREFYNRLKTEREIRVEKSGDPTYTEFEALMPWLVNFLLPEKRCRAVMEYDPTTERVMFYQADDLDKQ